MVTCELAHDKEKKETLEDLIHQYGNEIRNFAFVLTRRIDLADDITQDVFIKAFQKLDTYRGDASIKTWLLSITRHIAYDYRRSAYLRRVILVDVFFPQDTHPSAEQEVMYNFETEEVWRKTLTLPTKLREVLVLYAHSQLSSAEISALIGISEGAVRNRLHRARVKISHLLKEGEKIGQA